MTKPKRKQCAKCPWKQGNDPHEIPDGYSVELHRNLARTISEPGSIEGVGKPLHVFACHETHALPCVGWLKNQLTRGQNIPLRLAVRCGRIDAHVRTVGPQHATFEDTLPREPGS
jgi:hypothetical protein